MKFNKDKLKELEIKLAFIISNLTGLNYLKFDIKIKTRPNDLNDYLVVTSNELSNYMYPKMFKTLTIVEFGGNWSDIHADILFPSQGPEKLYWLPINYRYEHFDGGTNGCSLAYFWINSEGKIVRYADVKERS